MNGFFAAAVDEKVLDSDLTQLIRDECFTAAVKLILNLQHYPNCWGIMVHLAGQNPAINAFCESNPDLNELWIKCLAKKKYIDYPVIDTEGITHSVFERYKGAWFWGQYLLRRDCDGALTLLDLACQGHVYSAWVEKTDLLRAALKKSGGNTAIVSDLIQAMKEFSTTWWSAGYLNVAMILMDIADYFQEERDIASSDQCLEAAIEMFYVGFYLLEYPISENIINSLFPATGWTALFEDYADYVAINHIDAVKSKVMDALTQNFAIKAPEVFFPRLEALAEQKAQFIIQHVKPLVSESIRLRSC